MYTTHFTSDDSGKGLKSPISKGKKLIVLHAGNKNGFVDSTLSVLVKFLSGTDFREYRSDIISTDANSQFAHAFIVLGNVAYHNKQSIWCPILSCRELGMMY